MEERNIKISLERARDWYNRGGEYKELALSAFNEKEIKENMLPNSWEEFCNMHHIKENEYYIATDCTLSKLNKCQRNSDGDKNVLPSKEVAEAHLALMQLHQLRDYYRQGWLPDWENTFHSKYCIVIENNQYVIHRNITLCNFLSFQSEAIAKKFLENFKDLIETAGDLI